MNVTVKTTVTLELDEGESSLADMALWYASEAGGFGHEQSVELKKMAAALNDPVNFMAGGWESVVRKMRVDKSKPAR